MSPTILYALRAAQRSAVCRNGGLAWARHDYRWLAGASICIDSRKCDSINQEYNARRDNLFARFNKMSVKP